MVGASPAWRRRDDKRRLSVTERGIDLMPWYHDRDRLIHLHTRGIDSMRSYEIDKRNPEYVSSDENLIAQNEMNSNVNWEELNDTKLISKGFWLTTWVQHWALWLTTWVQYWALCIFCTWFSYLFSLAYTAHTRPVLRIWLVSDLCFGTTTWNRIRSCVLIFQ